MIVDEHLASEPLASPTRFTHSTGDSATEAIAVIGRGIVVPGALNVEALAALLTRNGTSVTQPPQSRWRSVRDQRLPADALDVVGGISPTTSTTGASTKFHPSNCASQSLQFMLLEAAEQALREAGYMEKEWNRQRTAVVVGAIFGGDFGNSLYAGLRLPEFKRELIRLLAMTTSQPAAIEIVGRYEELFLKQYPALLDETGSFTSSTLASRLSKTFDLMGGAMAIDAADASALAALDAATGLLRVARGDQVLCATGQSALDRASFERLSLLNRLVDRRQYESTAAERRAELHKSIPAEGVALVLLKRLSDARRDGDRILATIHDVTPVRSSATTTLPRRATATIQSTAQLEPATNQALQTVGNLQGAQGLVDVIEQSLATQPNSPIRVVSQATSSGLRYLATMEAGEPQSPVNKLSFDSSSAKHEAATNQPQQPEKVAEQPALILRLAATDQSALVHQLTTLAEQSWSAAQQSSRSRFDEALSWRAALVVTSTTTLKSQDSWLRNLDKSVR